MQAVVVLEFVNHDGLVCFLFLLPDFRLGFERFQSQLGGICKGKQARLPLTLVVLLLEFIEQPGSLPQLLLAAQLVCQGGKVWM